MVLKVLDVFLPFSSIQHQLNCIKLVRKTGRIINICVNKSDRKANNELIKDWWQQKFIKWLDKQSVRSCHIEEEK